MIDEILRSGADTRSHASAETKLNSYGLGLWHGTNTLNLGSCTANEIHTRWGPATNMWVSVAESNKWEDLWFEEEMAGIRKKLATFLELPNGTQVCTTPSGTDAHYTLLNIAFAKWGTDARILNVLIGGEESGGGIMQSALGKTFSTSTPRAKCELNENLLPGNLTGLNLPLRDAEGTPVDVSLPESVFEWASGGGKIILHAMACSKTGLAQPGRNTLDAWAKHFGDNMLVVCDASQGRFPPAQFREWIQQKYLVVFTASKFFGSFPFCGAIFIPKSLDVRNFKPITELSNFLTPFDVPETWTAWRETLSHWQNRGLWLRWKLGLEFMKNYFAIPSPDRTRAHAELHHSLETALNDIAGVEWIPAHDPLQSLACFKIHNATLAELDRFRTSLLSSNEEARIILGKPVQTGSQSAVLRVAISAPMVVDHLNGMIRFETLREKILAIVEQK